MSDSDEPRRVVLMVDDDEEDIYVTRRAFGGRRHIDAFHHVRSGEALFDYLAGRGSYAGRDCPRPGLILMDINMPRENGFSVLGRLRESPEHTVIPVVMLSTSTVGDDVDRAYRLGANSFIGKPSSSDEMRDIARHIDEFWFETALVP